MTGHFDIWLEREHGQPLWEATQYPLRKTGLFALSIGLWANGRQCASGPRSASGIAQRFARWCYSRPKPRATKLHNSRCWALPKTAGQTSCWAFVDWRLPNKRLDAPNKRGQVSTPRDGIGGEVSVLEGMTVILRGAGRHASVHPAAPVRHRWRLALRPDPRIKFVQWAPKTIGPTQA